MPRTEHYQETDTFFRELFHGAAGLVTDCDDRPVHEPLAALVRLHCARGNSCDLAIRYEVLVSRTNGTYLDPPETEVVHYLLRAYLDFDAQIVPLPPEIQAELFGIYEGEIKDGC